LTGRFKVIKIITKYFRRSLWAVFLLPLFAGGIVWAASTSKSANGLITPSDPSASTKIEERIAERKNSAPLQLSEERKQQIMKNCAVAQEGMQAIKTKDLAASQKRQSTYSGLATKLATTIDYLERQSINTASLKKSQSAFIKSINSYLSNYVIYKTALDDTIVMSCAKDPVGFDVSLISARQYRQKLSNNIKAIKSTVSDITKALSDAKQDLILTSSQEKGN
jgi:hypothetical protein